MKILEFKRSGIRIIAEFFRILNGFPNQDGKTEDKINDYIERMKTEDVALNKEGTAEGYLGIDIQPN